MTSGELREKFLKFFEEKGHTIIPSASLIPENDPTVLFTTAGMHPLVPFLLGEKHPGGEKLTNYQPCIRTDDIDEVGDNTHLTFFEMLGNWSLGNYFKDKAIKMSFEFLTSEKWLKLDKKRLAITIFESEDGKIDEDAKGLWLACGIPEVRIKGLKDNWWGPAGLEGPCGPDTEMFYWASNKDAPDVFDPQDKRWVEIWNDVFMEFYKRLTEQGQTKLADGIGPKYLREGEDYTFESLKQKNVDTGMGLERALAIINDKESVYETDLFLSIISKILSLAGIIHDANDIPLSVYPKGPIGSNLNQEESIISVRVMADHI
ncbi:MAG: alanine--tRNA ligase-related protein, partial [bacterium]|nr:alanine--tRNA ligase-related protein [bacterium]